MSGDRAGFEWFGSRRGAGTAASAFAVAAGSGALYVRDSKHTVGLRPEAGKEFVGFAARRAV